MKKLSTILFAIASISATAQCTISPQCTNEINLQCTNISNQSVNGSPCFTGTGQIPNSFNVNNAAYWSFDGDIFNYQNVNLQYNQEIYAKSGHSKMLANTSLSGHDTIWVYNGASITLGVLIANNGGNTVVLGVNTHLYVVIGNNQTEYFIGDTIHTQGNSSNDVRVLSCSNVPLNIKIISFKLKENTLYWEVTAGSNVKVEYSEDQSKWQQSEQTYFGDNHAEIFKTGFYRLRVDNEYSIVVRYVAQETQNDKNVELYRVNDLIATKKIN